jgi:hypothetical protein
MSQPRRHGPRIPEVNLFSRPGRAFSPPIPARHLELLLIALIVVVWAAVGVGIALLFGWRPPVGVGS